MENPSGESGATQESFTTSPKRHEMAWGEGLCRQLPPAFVHAGTYCWIPEIIDFSPTVSDSNFFLAFRKGGGAGGRKESNTIVVGVLVLNRFGGHENTKFSN